MLVLRIFLPLLTWNCKHAPLRHCPPPPALRLGFNDGALSILNLHISKCFCDKSFPRDDVHSCRGIFIISVYYNTESSLQRDCPSFPPCTWNFIHCCNNEDNGAVGEMHAVDFAYYWVSWVDLFGSPLSLIIIISMCGGGGRGGCECKRMNSMIISRSSANCRARRTKRGWMDVVGGLTKYTIYSIWNKTLITDYECTRASTYYCIIGIFETGCSVHRYSMGLDTRKGTTFGVKQ